MIAFRTGDIVADSAEALVNSVNCVGIMGRGVALAFKNSFPKNFEAYAAACKRKEVVPGRMFVFETGLLTGPRYIINFPTKRHWRGKSRVEDIEAGLDALVEEIDRLQIRSIAIPPLGSGLGGLDWEQVKPMIVRAVARVPLTEVIVYEPGGTAELPASVTVGPPPRMTTSRAILVLAIQRYLEAMLDPTISLLELHKLLYFMQEAGQPLRLQFAKGHYGPYSQNLRFVLKSINHYFLEVDLTQGDSPKALVELLPSAVTDARPVLDADSAAAQRLDKVFELIEGWETPHGLELLATVHWVMTHQAVASKEDLVRAVYSWNARKKQFTGRQIAAADATLRSLAWSAGFR